MATQGRKRARKVVSNFKGLEKVIAPDSGVEHEYAGDTSSLAGTIKFLRLCSRADVVIVDDDQRKLMLACLVRPFFRFRLVSADLILRPPKTSKARIAAKFKRSLFSRVDKFALYFKDFRGYERHFGIGQNRAVYVPFKVNGWEQISRRSNGPNDGDYVLCAGRTLRDVGTFVEAMRRAGCPGVLLQQRRELLAQHGTSEWSEELPANVKLVVDEGDHIESFLDFISGARLVVIPRFRGDIAATGISTYLVAMALGKCVIISEGPGAEDVLTDQAVVVPPEDAESLAREIKNLWEDDEKRRGIASRARAYAESLGGEQRLLSDILRASLDGLP